MSDYTRTFLDEVAELARGFPVDTIDAIADGLAAVRERGGRLFILGVGGGAGHASHAVNDFRKICDLESYTPTDNVSELTARINDEGWDTASRVAAGLAPGRATTRCSCSPSAAARASTTSRMNLVRAIELAARSARAIFGIVGTRRRRRPRRSPTTASSCPPPARAAHAAHEAFQAVVWHLLVSHPALARSRQVGVAAAGEP